MVYALFVGSGAFLVSLICGQWVVALLASRGLGKQISRDAPASHGVKAGTPTMGGLLIFGTVFLVTAPAVMLSSEPHQGGMQMRAVQPAIRACQSRPASQSHSKIKRCRHRAVTASLS